MIYLLIIVLTCTELTLPVGLLELELEVLPLKMPPNPKELPVFIEYTAISQQISREHDLHSAIQARFHAYAKAWWADYCALRPSHAVRLVPLLAADENSKQQCVCTLISPLQAERCLDTPLHAARFVRLIPYARRTRIGGAYSPASQFRSPAATLAQRQGDAEDHALLLASLLLGFGLDAYVAVGTVCSCIRLDFLSNIHLDFISLVNIAFLMMMMYHFIWYPSNRVVNHNMFG